MKNYFFKKHFHRLPKYIQEEVDRIIAYSPKRNSRGKILLPLEYSRYQQISQDISLYLSAEEPLMGLLDFGEHKEIGHYFFITLDLFLDTLPKENDDPSMLWYCHSKRLNYFRVSAKETFTVLALFAYFSDLAERDMPQLTVHNIARGHVWANNVWQKMDDRSYLDLLYRRYQDYEDDI